MKYIIYCLKHPDTLKIHYIGCTTTKLSSRLSQHIWDSKNKNSTKAKWVKSIINANKIPIIEKLEICDIDTWRIKEKYWISLYEGLANTNIGGDGIILNRSFDSVARSSESKYIPILSFTLDGIFVKEYSSAIEASKELNLLNTSIGNVLKGRSKSAGNLIWVKKEDYKGQNIKYERKKRSFLDNSIIVEISKEGYIINTYLNIKDCCNKTNLSFKDIHSCISGKQKTVKNRIFKLSK